MAICLPALAAQAERSGQHLDCRKLPRGFVLELSAVFQLYIWEKSGLRPLLPDDLPIFDEAADELYARVRENPSQFQDLKSAALCHRVVQLWLDRFSRSAPGTLGADVAIDQIDEDVLIDAVAQILWKHRRTLSAAS